MYIGKNFVENTLNYVNRIPNRRSCLRIGDVRRAFDDLQRIANAVVHPHYCLRTPEHFDFSRTSVRKCCGNLFGRGEVEGIGVTREDIKDAAFSKREQDRLLHMDEVEQEQLDGYLTARGLTRRRLLRASSFMSALAAIGPWSAKPAYAANSLEANNLAALVSAATAQKIQDEDGRIHTVESNDKTVHLGVFDTTLPPILKIDSGDTLSFPRKNKIKSCINERSGLSRIY